MPTKIGERIRTALLDRSISSEDVRDLVATAKAEKKFTPELKNELTALLDQHRDMFAEGTRQALADFLCGANTVRDLPDPAVLSKHATSVEWTPVAPGGSLYVDDLSFDDVVQGSIGDCYLVSALSSLAKVNPRAIEDAIHDNGDGTFNVRFFEKSASGKYRHVTKTVDSDLPIDFGIISKYGKARDHKERWVSVLEKGYAKWKGGYEVIGNGGNAGAVFEALTGKKSSYIRVRSAATDQLFQVMTKAVTSGRPVSVSTYAKGARVNYVGTGVVVNHAYSVLGTSVEGNQRYLTLRNPWGSSEPSADGNDDGIFKMKFQEFLKLFGSVNIGG